jgi:hypothetical protein
MSARSFRSIFWNSGHMDKMEERDVFDDVHDLRLILICFGGIFGLDSHLLCHFNGDIMPTHDSAL